MKKRMNEPESTQVPVSQPLHTRLSPRPDAIPVITHDDIAKRAYEIYVEKGCLQGQSEQDWRQAEREQRNRIVKSNQ